MDIRESIQTRNQTENQAEKRTRDGRCLAGWFLFIFLTAAICIAVYLVIRRLPDIGNRNYTVQMEQYFVEYSDEYDYWDVLTIDYPKIDGIDEKVQEQLNEKLYETAMDRADYWHFSPSIAVQEFQKDHFSIFCSDVVCNVTYHSQYLISVDFYELYSIGNPVWYTSGTERAVNTDLLTGQVYELEDIVDINKDFIRLWDQKNSEELQEEAGDEETIEILLSWFKGEDEELNARYLCRPFFYVTEDKNFVIGISFDPILKTSTIYETASIVFDTRMDAESLMPYRTESDFWEKYDRSQTAGEVIPCENRKENLWLGEDAGIWQ